MKIYDVHTHVGFAEAGPDVIEKMEEAGIYGGCVFSYPPKEYRETNYKEFDERLKDILEFVEPYKDRLFPILWIHPYEDNILEKIELAVASGIDGFKMICNDFYVYEEQCLKVLEKIAKFNKPVFFHTGILWDGKVSSQYNRPLNWEALLRIKGLKFAMGHCSWPWHDECIALYGKFLNALTTGEAAEMFLDVTPGTPEIYREELYKKIFFSGYDTDKNVFFGTDCSAENYNSRWAKKWLKIDGEIMDKFGIGEDVKENIYNKNLMYFLGKIERDSIHKLPTPDNAD